MKGAMVNKTVRWRYWTKPGAQHRAWELVFLSFGIDPLEYGKDLYSPTSRVLFQSRPEICERISLLVSSLNDSGRFELGWRDADGDQWLSGVYLVDFVQWCCDLDLAIPSELVATDASDAQTAANKSTDKANTLAVGSAADDGSKTARHKWDDDALRALLAESKGVTQDQLAVKHGVSRQRISTLLKQAKDRLETSKAASPFPSAPGSILKIKGTKYGSA